MQFKSISLREAVTPPNGPTGLLGRKKEFVASAELTITREGDSYVLTGTDGRVVEIPSAVVLFAVRFSDVVGERPAGVADNLSAVSTKQRSKRNG